MSTLLMPTPPVAFIRPELSAVLSQYKLIRDALGGETVIKANGPYYLPIPNADDKTAKNKTRYAAYTVRAVFYNVTRRTMGGLIGQVFMREPEIKIPPALQAVVDDATGSGISIEQTAKKAVELTLAYSRSGLFVDYPEVPEGGATVEDIQLGLIRPTINVYPPHQIINWRVKERGATEVLSLVVLAESYVSADDGFEMKNSLQFRVLRLTDDNTYIQEIYTELKPTDYDGVTMNVAGKAFNQKRTVVALGKDGKPLTEIPFTFIGSQNNDSSVDTPNFYDLASLNIAHYRNSADYEEAVYVAGQPTVVVTGLNQDWYDNVLNKQINFGSRGGIPLPVGADAKLIQAEERTMMKEAMEAKENQMVALGAKLVQQGDFEKTAFESKVDATQANSTLGSVATNVSAAFKWALEWCALLVTGTEPKAAGANAESAIEFKLNQDYDVSSMTPEERAEIMLEWQGGALSFTEMRDAMRRAGVATQTDEEAKAEIASDKADEMAQAAAFDPVLGAPAVPGAKSFIQQQSGKPGKPDPKANNAAK